jgi:hypothetical protein
VFILVQPSPLSLELGRRRKKEGKEEEECRQQYE